MTTHTDPVCGMKVDGEATALQSTYQETTYYFCAQGCKARFDENPKQYASTKAAS